MNDQNGGWQRDQFVNYTLSKADGPKIKAWVQKGWLEQDWLSVVIAQGYKITLNQDRRNRCFACWLIPVNREMHNAGLILSGRGGSPQNALIECLWKHIVLFKGDWPKPTSDGSWTWDSE